VTPARFLLVVPLVALCACGGSLQPPGGQTPLGVPAGFMRMTVRVAAPLDFEKYAYEIVLDTAGNGLTPEFGSPVDWKPYSDAIEIGGNSGAPYVQVIQYVRNPNPNLPPAQIRLSATPSQFHFNPRSGGSDSAFSVTFERSLLAANSAKLAHVWRFNAAVLQAGEAIDTMGACATCFRSPGLPVDAVFERTIDAQGGSRAPPAARIQSVVVENTP
jgi:hypothetical protein